MDIGTVVEAYVECGKKRGFCRAETILMKYLPEDKPDGKCFDVLVNKRYDLVEDLKKATKDTMPKFYSSAH